MPDSTGTLLLYGLAGLFGGWLIAVTAVWFRLISRHRQTYEALVDSSFAPSSNAPGPWVTLKFIASRRHRTMGDLSLSLLSDAALAAFVAYVVVFLSLVISTSGS